MNIIVYFSSLSLKVQSKIWVVLICKTSLWEWTNKRSFSPWNMKTKSFPIYFLSFDWTSLLSTSKTQEQENKKKGKRLNIFLSLKRLSLLQTTALSFSFVSKTTPFLLKVLSVHVTLLKEFIRENEMLKAFLLTPLFFKKC